MNEGILGAIANPQLADIAGALNYRQAQIDKDEAKRKELRMNQLIAQAIPNMAEDSPVRKIFEEDPKAGAMLSKMMGIPLNDGEAWEKFRGNVAQLHSLAKADPRMAIERANAMKAENDRLGIVDQSLNKWVNGVNSAMEKGDRDGVITQFNALGVMNDNLNPVKADVITAKDKEDIRLKEKELDWKMSRPAGGDSAPVESIQTWNQYQKLGGDKTEEGRQFGRSHSFISKEGQQLSAYTDKALGEAIDSSNTLSTDAGRYRAIASDLMANAKNMKVGALSSMSEYVKDFTGGQDDITSLRKQALQIVNSEAIKSLPPGSATEVDTAMALAPLPKENADPIYIAKWLQSVARLNEKAAEYNTFKANYISEKGHQRDLLSAWKNKNKAQPVQKDKHAGSDQIKSLLEKY